MSDVASVLLNQWQEFKTQNDARLAELEKYGAATAEVNAKVDRLNDSISDLEARLNRPQGPGSGSQDVEERLKAFRGWLSRGIVNAAMQEGTTTEGGYVVPVPMYDDIVKGLQDQSIMRQAGARVIPMTRWKMDVPTLTNSTTAILTAEEAAVSQVEPTVGTVQAVAYKYTKLSKVSKELVADSLFDVWGTILSGDFAQAFAKAENTAFSTGTGSAQPQGVFVGATSGVTAAAVDTVTADEVIELYYSIDHRHAGAGTWMMKNASAKVIRKLKDGDGQYLWTPGFAGQPSAILGRPLIINDSAPAMTTGLKPILFGDFSYYWIFDRQEMEMQRLVELYAGNGQVGYLADKRFDGHVMLATAFYVITMA